MCIRGFDAFSEATTPVECSVYAAVVNAWVLYGTIFENRINMMEYSTAIVRVCDNVIVKAVSSGAPSAINAITSLLQDTLYFICDNITTCYTEFVNRATSRWASSHISNFVSILYFTLRALRLATSMTFLSNSSINIVTTAQQFLIPVVEWIYSQDVDAVYDVIHVIFCYHRQPRSKIGMYTTRFTSSTLGCPLFIDTIYI
ncbi:hypothetical protein EIN_359210 [Entamoeba invadens IP1]|uniref:Uncharacterized protein n=1 Tax=Entamoeba invadens IP1 TaxID=370355 RepID=A0A0A1U7K4_ENTIV|nr:hypothetical protein EIN_359210 [Entamoeba invadens IP1]ELP90838.1 hypothetical protein EIN_359210 [Entamoeba invadens IP1]|eukprot:XP_004257609.1 hypothetical protein EIN_359210 [Entamoeba invadens IP1]